MDRKAIALFAIPMAVLTVLGWVGDALAPSLLDRAPLLLLVCNPRLRNLVLVSPMVDVGPFVLVAVGRLSSATHSSTGSAGATATRPSAGWNASSARAQAPCSGPSGSSAKPRGPWSR
jgi:hypothetical protein